MEHDYTREFFEFLSTLSLRRATIPNCKVDLSVLTEFLSTLSLRRATRHALHSVSSPLDFYPRSPCGERPKNSIDKISGQAFLSTLSLRRATPRGHCSQQKRVYFYPRSPCGERLSHFSISKVTQEISIHALLAESDASEF